MSSILFVNGPILTMDPKMPEAEAVWVENDRIRAVGTFKELTYLAPDAEHYSLNGQCLLPGFVEAHIHVWKVGNLQTHTLDLRGTTSILDLQEQLRAFAAERPEAAWIQARGFNEAAMLERRMPTREDLDAVVPDRPVLVQRTCAHILVLNSLALAYADITAETSPPVGGEIHLGPDGYPNGILTETAQGLGFGAAPAFTEADYVTMISAATETLLAHGFTTATDPGVMPDLLTVYRKMEAEKRLRMRFNVMPIRLPDGGKTALPLPERSSSDFLTINTVKFFADGGLSGKTSAVSRPYRGTANEFGVLRLPPDFFYELAHEPHEKGWKIATHAIGDVAIEGILSTYERLYRETPSPARHRIEHLGLPNSDHLKRVSAAGIAVAPQPMFLRELGGNFRQYLDDAFLAQCYPIRSMLEAGITVAFSSDAPVVKRIHPLENLHAAYFRRDLTGGVITPEESVSVMEGLYACTMGGAIANSMEDQIGSLTPGKFADFVILETSPLAVDPERLPEVKIKETWVGGKRVFAA